MLRTVSEGCAPLGPNHSRRHVPLRVITWFLQQRVGCNLPTVSIKRPSRGAHESATLIR